MIEEENNASTETSKVVDVKPVEPVQTSKAIDGNSGEAIETTTGLIAYLTLIGFVIALVLNNDKTGETKSFGAFHLRQSLGLMITGIALMIAMTILSTIMMSISFSLLSIVSIIYPISYISILGLLIMGIINAAQGKKQELPVIGGFISKTFGKAFE